MNVNPIITFIIPTIGRLTIKDTIESLYNQTNPNWNAIIVCDGIDINFECNDKRIQVIKIDKSGYRNYSGNVRNKGLELVKTDWIGFVDDDDFLSKDYIDRLIEEINETKDITTIIFRMLNTTKGNLGILPQPKSDNFYECFTGISFAIKKSLYQQGYKFEPSHTEDFTLLDNIRRGKNKMVISPWVTYLVNSELFKNKDIKISDEYERVFIN